MKAAKTKVRTLLALGAHEFHLVEAQMAVVSSFKPLELLKGTNRVPVKGFGGDIRQVKSCCYDPLSY